MIIVYTYNYVERCSQNWQSLPEPPVSPLLLRRLQGGKVQRIKRSKAK